MNNFGSDQMKSAPALTKLYMLLKDLHELNPYNNPANMCNMLG
jgi:hypothetical protein